MEKIFKAINVVLSYLLVFVMVWLVFAVPTYLKSDFKIDFFEAAAIAENIENLEMNMTSIVYVQNDSGDWEEYRRLHGNENRIWVGREKMPKNLEDAFIAIEDETFYSHKGVNWKRTFGAIGNYFFKFDDTEFGGSTITQQLIKNITEDKGRNALRKMREIVRALLIEDRLEKPQILEAYLNTIALGNGICGVQVASNYYFNKDVSELTLTECAALAAITKNPSRYNPITDMEENKTRRNTVMNKMLELGLITAQEYSKAYNKDITLDTSQEINLESDINNYFIDALIEQIIADFTVKYKCSEQLASSMLYNGGYKIYSTMDIKVQDAMEAVYTNTDKYFYLKGKNLEGETVNVQSAMTIMDYEGHIVGLVGGAGEKTVNRGLNRATSAPRQPGSTMKPIGVYALAIENDLVHYTSKVIDAPIKSYYPDGRSGPREWYGKYKGAITIDYAIRKSANTIPVKLLQDIGVDVSYEFLTEKLGLKYLTDVDKNLSSLALGGCEYGMTTTESAAAYAIFGNQGYYHEPTTYYKVERFDGEVILDYDESGEQVISGATATIMNHLLQGVVYGSEGTGRGISWYNTMKAYAKTGTSSESNDLWMVAGTPYYVGSVWYGFDMQQQVRSTSAAATVWREVMRAVHTGLEKKTFEDSEDVYRRGSGYYKDDTKPNNLTTLTGSSDEDEEDSSSKKDKDKDKKKDKNSSKTSSSTSSKKENNKDKDDKKENSSENTTTETNKPTDSSKEENTQNTPSSSGVASSEEQAPSVPEASSDPQAPSKEESSTEDSSSKDESKEEGSSSEDVSAQSINQ